jgi:hypothetical protein
LESRNSELEFYGVTITRPILPFLGRCHPKHKKLMASTQLNHKSIDKQIQ